MANMCYNEVVFCGNEAAVENVIAFFKELQEKEDQNIMPWVISPLIEKHGYMDHVWQKDGTVHFRSRWFPKLDLLAEIAMEYGVNFVNKYSETGMPVFGEATYTNGAFTDTRLDSNDFKGIYYDNEAALFVFEGNTYKDDQPIWELLLEQKKARDLNFESTSNITKEELIQMYHELLPGDFVLKFAEHKNFDGARKEFFDLDDDTATRLSNYISNNNWNNPEKFVTHDKYIAMNFLRKLVTEWDWQQQGRQNQNGRGL